MDDSEKFYNEWLKDQQLYNSIILLPKGIDFLRNMYEGIRELKEENKSLRGQLERSKFEVDFCKGLIAQYADNNEE